MGHSCTRLYIHDRDVLAFPQGAETEDDESTDFMLDLTQVQAGSVSCHGALAGAPADESSFGCFDCLTT